MVDGHADKIRVGFIIQARMKSSRLPGKILLPLPFNSGKPLLKWITDAVKHSAHLKEIVVATSTNKENDVLESFCEKEGIGIYRGDERNVLSRYIAIIKRNAFDVIVRLTADNPVLDVRLLDSVIQKHYDLQRDYTKTVGLPMGMNFEVICPKAIMDLEAVSLTDTDKEHVTQYIRNHSTNMMELRLGREAFENVRITIDYPSDYAFASFLTAEMETDEIPSFDTVTRILHSCPWILEINKDNIQKLQVQTEEQELRTAVGVLNQLELYKAASILSMKMKHL